MVVGERVVVGGDGQFDAFARQGHHSLLYRRVAVAAEGEGVYMRVASHHARRRNLAANPHRQRVSPALRERELLSVDTVLETA